MQKRAMGCCESEVNKHGPPEKGAWLQLSLPFLHRIHKNYGRDPRLSLSSFTIYIVCSATTSSSYDVLFSSVLTIMPHLFIDGEWFGPRNGHQLDFELLGKALDKFVAYSVDDPKLDHVSKAIAFDEEGDLPSAIASFRAATKFKPKVPENWFNLGVALRDEGNPAADEEATLKEAVGAFARSLKLNPKNKDAQAELEHADLADYLSEMDEL
jgi:tetratricopeptide (TPR) repeat protein